MQASADRLGGVLEDRTHIPDDTAYVAMERRTYEHHTYLPFEVPKRFRAQTVNSNEGTARLSKSQSGIP